MKIFKNKDSFIYRFINLFIKCEITAASAEMAYYLVFAFFPLMMIIHASFSMVLHEFSMDDTFFYKMVPNLVEDLLNTYIQYISAHSNLSFLLLGIFLTVYTLSKFMKSTKRTIRKIYGSDGYSNPIAEWSVSILLSVIVVFAFFVSLILLILGGQILKFIEANFSIINIEKIQSLSKFLFTPIIIYCAVTLLYLWIPNVSHGLKDIFPGTLFTSGSWFLLSYLFSFYMNNFSKYSLIYGSIGAFIMLLVWIYMTCLLLLVGAMLNALIYERRQKRLLQNKIKQEE